MHHAPRRWRIAPLKEIIMIDFYTCATPNGQKIHIMLEETGLEYSERRNGWWEFSARLLSHRPQT